MHNKVHQFRLINNEEKYIIEGIQWLFPLLFDYLKMKKIKSRKMRFRINVRFLNQFPLSRSSRARTRSTCSFCLNNSSFNLSMIIWIFSFSLRFFAAVWKKNYFKIFHQSLSTDQFFSFINLCHFKFKNLYTSFISTFWNL